MLLAKYFDERKFQDTNISNFVPWSFLTDVITLPAIMKEQHIE